MRIWSSNTTHHEYNLHRVVTTLSIKLKCVNTLELKIKPWPVESNDLMNQTGAVEGATGELEPARESNAGEGTVCERTGSGCRSLWQRRYFGMMTSWVKLGSDSGTWMTKSIRSACILILGRAKHRQETTPGLHIHTFWALSLKKKKASILFFSEYPIAAKSSSLKTN